jgi:hypothetical protein
VRLRLRRRATGHGALRLFFESSFAAREEAPASILRADVATKRVKSGVAGAFGGRLRLRRFLGRCRGSRLRMPAGLSGGLGTGGPLAAVGNRHEAADLARRLPLEAVHDAHHHGRVHEPQPHKLSFDRTPLRGRVAGHSDHEYLGSGGGLADLVLDQPP